MIQKIVHIDEHLRNDADSKVLCSPTQGAVHALRVVLAAHPLQLIRQCLSFQQ